MRRLYLGHKDIINCLAISKKFLLVGLIEASKQIISVR